MLKVVVDMRATGPAQICFSHRRCVNERERECAAKQLKHELKHRSAARARVRRTVSVCTVVISGKDGSLRSAAAAQFSTVVVLSWAVRW